jgi:hypothetical protein
MSKYLLTYRGPATPPDEMTEEQSTELMGAWNTWIEQTGSALVDIGQPCGARASVADDAAAADAPELSGYSIVEADGLDGAKALVAGHPFLSEGKGRFFIDIYELLAVPGM